MPPSGPGPWRAGFRAKLHWDGGRSFGARTTLDGVARDSLLARRVRIEIWCPSEPGAGRPMRYADYLQEGAGAEAAEADSTASQALAAHKAGPLRRGANEARLDSLRTAPVLARRDAAAAGSFPLIVYPPSINADPSENALLLEYLASQGLVIASAPCLGRDGPAVARGVSGATAQREDLEFVLGDACRHPFADARGVGLLGFSWGGSSALLRIRDTRTTDPEVRLFDEQHLLRYAVEWGPDRAEELGRLLAANLEVHSNSADTRYWLAQIHLARGDVPSARLELGRALAIAPQHDRALRLLSQLTAAMEGRD